MIRHLLLFSAFALTVGCAPTGTSTGQDMQYALSSSVDSEGGHVASLSSAAAISNRPTKLDEGRNTAAPQLNLTDAEVMSRSRLTVPPKAAVAITEPTACDWTSVVSGYRDRTACRSGAAGSHAVAARLESLDPHVASEIEDAEAFGWGPDRLLGRMGAALNVGPDNYASTKGGTWVRCADVGPTDPCGSNRWDLVTRGIKASRWIDGQLVEQWRRDSSWIPPGIDALSQQWEPVHQAGISGNLILIPESHGRVSAVDRATGEVSFTLPSPSATPDIYTAVMSGIAVHPDGSAWYTVIQLDPVNPFTTVRSWLVKASMDGTIRSQTIANLSQPDQACVTTFAFNQFLPVPQPAPLPWPPYVGAVGPMFTCGGFPHHIRPVMNATPAISYDGRTVYVVARTRQNSDHTQVIAVDSGSLAKIWTRMLRDHLNDGCGVLIPYAEPGEVSATKCRPGALTGIDRETGLMPGGRGNDLAVSSPVPTPDGGVLIGTYSPYDNERGHLFRLTLNGHIQWAYNFGWNSTPAIRFRRGAPLPSDFRVITPDSHYDNAPFRLVGLDGQFATVGQWANTQAGTERCIRDGQVVTCAPAARLPGTGQNNKACQVWSNAAGGGSTCANVTPGGARFGYMQRSPVVVGTGDVWSMSTDGFAELHSGVNGAVLERVFVDTSLVQADSAMTQDSSGRLYIDYGGNLTVLAPRDVQ